VALTLPVQLVVGEHTVNAGTITLKPGDRLLPSLAECLHEIADVIHCAEEVSPDASPE